jgi:hypothetical protein
MPLQLIELNQKGGHLEHTDVVNINNRLQLQFLLDLLHQYVIHFNHSLPETIQMVVSTKEIHPRVARQTSICCPSRKVLVFVLSLHCGDSLPHVPFSLARFLHSTGCVYPIPRN